MLSGCFVLGVGVMLSCSEVLDGLFVLSGRFVLGGYDTRLSAGFGVLTLTARSE